MEQSYPLNYPKDKQRTMSPEHARFNQHSIYYATKELLSELNKLGANNITISSNLMTKADGLPYANQKVIDNGIAVYFTLKNKKQCFACDRWKRVEDNNWAIAKSVSAIRGLERWGSKDMVDSAFEGFKALPTSEQITQTKVRYFSGITSIGEAKQIYKNLVALMHPDAGGKQEDFIELNNQFNQFKQSLEEHK